jgi:hypothetical protein
MVFVAGGTTRCGNMAADAAECICATIHATTTAAAIDEYREYNARLTDCVLANIAADNVQSYDDVTADDWWPC